jgi:hypothetical protein
MSEQDEDWDKAVRNMYRLGFNDGFYIGVLCSGLVLALFYLARAI